MPNRKDLIGQKFGPLTVIKLDIDKTNQQKRAFWLCSCDNCNKVHSVRSDSLQKITRCPDDKNRTSLIKEEAGNVYGKLTVIEKAKKNNINKNAFWLCQCECGNQIIVNGIDLRRGHTHSCGCIKSLGEERISNLLKENNIIFEKEKTFENCINPETNARLRFDFFLPEYNILIEYQGSQHYETSNSGWNTKEKLTNQIKRDKIKKQWCINNNKKLIKISYKNFNNITIDKLLGKESFNNE